MEIVCGTVVGKNHIQGWRFDKWSCKKIRDCDDCNTAVAKRYLHLSESIGMCFVAKLSRDESRKLGRQIGKDRYRRFPQKDGTDIVWHNAPSEAGEPLDLTLEEMKSILFNIPEGNRLSGDLGGAQFKPASFLKETPDDEDKPKTTVKTYTVSVKDVSVSDFKSMCNQAHANAMKNTIEKLPFDQEWHLQQGANSILYELKKIVEGRGLEFGMFRPSKFTCSLVDIREWKEEHISTKLQVEPLPVAHVKEKKVIRRAAPSREWMKEAQNRVNARAA